MLKENNTKIFSDYEEVNCNECEHYWDNSCDGVHKGDKKQCSSFIATRNTVIPQQIKKLQQNVKELWVAVICLFSCVVLSMLGVILCLM